MLRTDPSSRCIHVTRGKHSDRYRTGTVPPRQPKKQASDGSMRALVPTPKHMRTRCGARRKRDRDSQGSPAHAGGPAARAQAEASLPDDDPSTDAQAQFAGGVVSATPAKREPGSVEPQAHQASGIAPLDGTVSPAGSRSALAPPRQLVGRLVQIVTPVGDLDEDAPGVKSWVWDEKASSSSWPSSFFQRRVQGQQPSPAQPLASTPLARRCQRR